MMGFCGFGAEFPIILFYYEGKTEAKDDGETSDDTKSVKSNYSGMSNSETEDYKRKRKRKK